MRCEYLPTLSLFHKSKYWICYNTFFFASLYRHRSGHIFELFICLRQCAVRHCKVWRAGVGRSDGLDLPLGRYPHCRRYPHNAQHPLGLFLLVTRMEEIAQYNALLRWMPYIASTLSLPYSFITTCRPSGERDAIVHYISWLLPSCQDPSDVGYTTQEKW